MDDFWRCGRIMGRFLDRLPANPMIFGGYDYDNQLIFGMEKRQKR